jgi:hypothetical protein
MTSAELPRSTDIRDQLRRDHQSALAELDALWREADERRSCAMLARLRRSWLILALAKETVVYRAIEGVESASDSTRADERFAGHETVESLLSRLSRLRLRAPEWIARFHEVRGLIVRSIETEREELFAKLAQRFDEAGLAELGESFERALAKLTLLEEAKAA